MVYYAKALQINKIDELIAKGAINFQIIIS